MTTTHPGAPEIDLSVIVPCHNEADTLPAQLESLLAQSWEGRWEIIVVDNASTDATASIARQFAGGTIDLRVVSATERAGVAYARNVGARESRARSIAFCDGDDVAHPGWINAIGDALRTEPLVTGTLEADSLNEPWLRSCRPMGSKDVLPKFGQIPFARGNNSGMHRSLWSDLSGYDEDFHGLEDIEFSIRAAARGITPTLVPKARMAYRFRTELRSAWKQGFFYGVGKPAMARQADEMGLEGPRATDGLRTWLWLLAKLPTMTSRGGRHGWTFVLANRVGALVGALRVRRLHL